MLSSLGHTQIYLFKSMIFFFASESKETAFPISLVISAFIMIYEIHNTIFPFQDNIHSISRITLISYSFYRWELSDQVSRSVY